MAVENLLSARDIACFRDAKEIPAGNNIKKTIDWALSKSRMLAVIITEASVLSDWVGEELESFRKRKRPIVAIAVSGIEIPTKWGFLKDTVYISDSQENLRTSRPKEETIDRIVDAISFKRRNIIARILTTVIVMFFVSLLSLALIQYRDVQHQRDLTTHERNEAEQLVEFMVTDLKEQLEPLSQLALLVEPADRALRYFRSSMSSNRRIHDDLHRLELRWRTIRNLVEVHIDLGNIEDARRYSQEMLQVAETIRKRAVTPSPIQFAMLAYSHRLEGDVLILEERPDEETRLDDARERYEAAYRLYQIAVDTEDVDARFVQGWIALHTQMAKLAELNGYLREAIDLHDAALAIVEEFADTEFARHVVLEHRFVAYTRRGDIYLRLGDRDTATALYADAYDMAIERQHIRPGDLVARRALSIISDKLGNLLFDDRKYSEAMDYYSVSLEIAQELSSYDRANEDWQADHATSLDYIGNTLRGLEKFDEALSFFERAMDIRKELVNDNPNNSSRNRSLAYSHNKMGTTFYDILRYREAITHFENSLSIFERQGDDVDSLEARAVNLRMLAVVYHDLSELDKAVAHCEAGSRIAQVLSESELSRWGTMAKELSKLCLSMASRNS